MNVDYQAIEACVRKAGGMISSAQMAPELLHQKEGIANFVTDYDVAVQTYLIDALSAILPGCAFFGEEDTAGNTHASSGYVFIIDPIDGTTNFVFGYRHSCVSVGLALDGQVIAGWVYKPYTEEMYAAIRGQGSFLNGQRLQMNDLSIRRGIVAFGCARYNEGDVDLLFDAVKELYLNSLAVRNGGSAALDLCRIASGANVAYLELKLNPYDYAAASVIIEEAGGTVGQVDGSPITLDCPCSIVGGTYIAAEEVRNILYRLSEK